VKVKEEKIKHRIVNSPSSRMVEQLVYSRQVVNHSKWNTKIEKPLSKPKYQVLFVSVIVL